MKYLGLHLDRKLSWKNHISNLTTKVKKRLSYISFLFSKSCQRARITLYKSLVLSLLDYCCVVYNPRLKGLTEGLEDCTRTFLQSINLGPALEDTSVRRYCNRLRQLGLEPLVLRRIKASLVLAYKIIFGLVPVSNLFFSPLCLDAAVSLFQVARERQELSMLTHILFNCPDRPIKDGQSDFRKNHLPSSLPGSGMIFHWTQLPASLYIVLVSVFRNSTFSELNM